VHLVYSFLPGNIFYHVGQFLAIVFYVYPRYEYDKEASGVSFGLEEAYTAEMIDFYSVRDIRNKGLSGDKVVFVYDFSQINGDDLEKLLSEKVSSKIIFYEKPYPWLSAETLSNLIDKYNVTVGFLELNYSTDLVREALSLRKKENSTMMFRVHTIKPEEIENLSLDYNMVLRRWIRARNERSVDFFWIQPPPLSLNISYNEYGIQLAGIINPVNVIENPIPKNYFPFQVLLVAGGLGIVFFYSPFFLILSVVVFLVFQFSTGFSDASLYLAGLCGTFGITGIFRQFRNHESSPVMKFFSVVALAFTLGILINALSFSFESVNQIFLPHGVKFVLLFLPCLVFLKEFLNYGINELKGKLHWTDLMFIIFVILFALYYIMRSGNSGFVLSIERKFRDSLEIFIGIRPRFKVIIGIPALWLYFKNQHLCFGRYSFLVPVLGSVSLCSIINSFQHVHSPIQAIFFRELLGLLIGLAIGIIISFFLPKGKKQINTDKPY